MHLSGASPVCCEHSAHCSMNNFKLIRCNFSVPSIYLFQYKFPKYNKRLKVHLKLKCFKEYLEPLSFPHAISFSSSFKKLNYSSTILAYVFPLNFGWRVIHSWWLWSIFGNEVSKNFALYPPRLHGFRWRRNTWSLSLDRLSRIYLDFDKYWILNFKFLHTCGRQNQWCCLDKTVQGLFPLLELESIKVCDVIPHSKLLERAD